MKQRITVNELSKLSDDQKDSLHKWWTPKKGDLYTWHYTDGNKSDHAEYMVNDTHHNIFDDPEANLISIPLLSIGQMIEYLTEEQNFKIEVASGKHQSGDDYFMTAIRIDGVHLGTSSFHLNFCDALWEVMKYYL